MKDDIWPDPMRWFREAQEGGMFAADGEGELDEFEDEYEDGAPDEGEDGECAIAVVFGKDVQLLVLKEAAAKVTVSLRQHLRLCLCWAVYMISAHCMRARC